MTRRLLQLPLLALALALTMSVAAASPPAAPPVADAASCIRIIGGNFDAPGNDNYAANLNGEYVTIKNYCSTARIMTNWRVTDYGTKHTYSFRTGYRINPGISVKLHTGRGTNGTYHVYWGRSYGAVWNNTAPERAYLRNSSNTVVSSWSPY